MISPIQQNVVFKGVENLKSADKFTGNMPAARSVRGDYANTVNSVLDVQKTMQGAVDAQTGANLNTVA